jgi:hypothetical protein
MTHTGGRVDGDGNGRRVETCPDTTPTQPTTAAPSLGNTTQRNGMERNGTGFLFLELAVYARMFVCSPCSIFWGIIYSLCKRAASQLQSERMKMSLKRGGP